MDTPMPAQDDQMIGGAASNVPPAPMSQPLVDGQMPPLSPNLTPQGAQELTPPPTDDSVSEAPPAAASEPQVAPPPAMTSPEATPVAPPPPPSPAAENQPVPPSMNDSVNLSEEVPAPPAVNSPAQPVVGGVAAENSGPDSVEAMPDKNQLPADNTTDSTP